MYCDIPRYLLRVFDCHKLYFNLQQLLVFDYHHLYFNFRNLLFVLKCISDFWSWRSLDTGVSIRQWKKQSTGEKTTQEGYKTVMQREGWTRSISRIKWFWNSSDILDNWHYPSIGGIQWWNKWGLSGKLE